MKHERELFWHYWLPVLAMLTVITVESTDLLSGAHTAELLKRVLSWIGIHLVGQRLEMLNMVLRKSGHMLGYGLLCFCWLMLLRGAYWLQHDYSHSLKGTIQVRRMWWRPQWAGLAVLCTFLVASADELHQMSIRSRTGTWWDVALDTSAAVLVTALVLVKTAWRCRDSRERSMAV